MKLNLACRTYDSIGGGGEFAPVIAQVELCDENFGDALREIELTLCFRCSRPCQDSDFRDVYRDFHDTHCELLPHRRFLRKKGLLTLEVLAEFASAEDMDPPAADFNLEWQHSVLDLLIGELEVYRKKFKTTDDFRLGDFIAWLRAQHEHLPQSQQEAKELTDRWLAKSAEEDAQLSEWDQLGLDWDDCHPQARDVTSDPRLWSLGYEFAPNGNDNGADVLSMFREEKSRWKRGGGKAFFRHLSQGWGFDVDAPADDSINSQMNREATIGLAFAFLKLFASCPDWLADKAISEIQGYQAYLETHYLDWKHRAECLEYQGLMLDCLRACPRQ